MNAKEIKSNLKLAKEAIKAKDYKVTLRHCKDVLKSDKNNYTALVFIGIAAQELDQPHQALTAFQRAIAQSPDQVLAWQGLCTFYEKNNENKDSALVEVYEKLLEFYESDSEKYFWTLVKYIPMLIEAEKLHETIEITQKAQSIYQNDNAKYCTLCDLLVSAIYQKNELRNHYGELLLIGFDVLVNQDEESVSSAKLEQHYINYIRYLIEILELNKSKELCFKMRTNYPDNAFAIGLLCQTYVYQFCENGTMPPPDVLSLLENLMKSDGNSDICIQTKLLIDFNDQKYHSVLKSLKEEATDPSSNNSLVSYFFVAISYKKLHQHESSNKFSEKALNLCASTTPISAMFSKRLNVIMSENSHVLGNKKLMEKQLNFLTLLDDKTEKILVLMFRISLKLGHSENELNLIRSQLSSRFPESTEFQNIEAKIQISECNFEIAKRLLLSMVSANVANDETYGLLGHLSWSNEKWNDGFNFFMKAAKFDPYNSEYFLYIGHYYDRTNDRRRACRCYQKAFQLDPTSEEAGCACSNLLSALGEKEENYQLLTEVTENAKKGSMKWAFHRLGVHHLQNDEPTAAIKVFQNSLHADSEDFLCWELLAEAYKSRGSYNAAMKAYIKASQLNQDSVHCQYQIAVLKKKLGLYTEALEDFRVVLNKKDDYIPAVKDFVATLLLLGRSHLENSFNKSCVSCCQEAILVLSRILAIRPNILCLWKLAGDACTIVAPLSSDIFSILIPIGIFSKFFQAVESEYVASKSEILKLGSRCYGQALALSSETAPLWHDLGLNYLYQAEESKEASCEEQLFYRSILSLKKAVSVSPGSYFLWNSLGVAATKSGKANYGLAQHAFIRSIKLEHSNVVAWTNLGLLYLNARNVELAHKALRIAQAVEPSYGNCWVAQALIAETIQHDETLDLFRHSTELTKHNEAAIGYASNVCQALKETRDHSSLHYKYAIQTLSAVTASSDALFNYTDRKTDTPEAYNMLGMLLERQKLYNSAATCYKKALQLAKDQEDKLTGICLNFARCLCYSNQPADAALMYRNMKISSYTQSVYKADASFLNNDLKDAILEYQNGIKFASSDKEKGLLEAALAMCSYKMGNITQAKTLLLECSHKNPKLVESRLALCALGILQSDKVLSQAALRELLPYQDNPMYMEDIALFKCYVLTQQGHKDVRKIISEFIHKDPKNAKLWLLLASTTLQLSPEDSNLAARCSAIAEKLGETSEWCYILVCLTHLAAGYSKLSLKWTKKALHIYPYNTKLQICLCCALLGCCLSKSEKCSCNLVIKLLDTLSNDQRTNMYTQALLSFSLLHLKNYKNCNDAANEVHGDEYTKYASLFQCLCRIPLIRSDENLEESLHALTKFVFENSSISSGWMILLKVFHKFGKFQEMELVLKQWSQRSNEQTSVSPKQRLVPLLLQTFLMRKVPKESKDDHSFNNAIKEILKVDPRCPVAYFLQGVCLHEEKIKRLTSKRLCTVLESSEYEERNIELLAAKLICNLAKKNDEHLLKVLTQYVLATKSKDVEHLIKELKTEAISED